MAVALMFLTSVAMTALGLVVAVRMTDFEGFGAIQNMAVMPILLLSGAMFPTNGIPVWLNACGTVMLGTSIWLVQKEG